MKPFFIAISMYSRLPAPQFPWEEKDRRRAICFFPRVGIFVGAAFLLAFWLLERMGANALLKGAVLAAVPLLVTGGIHMDGFLDTCDARASWGDREKKLEILKDSHTGAFAVISGVLYLLLLAGVYSMLTWEEAKPAAAGFVLSRAFSGLSVALLPNARGSGMLSELTKDSSQKKTAAAMAFWILLSGAAAALGNLTGGVFSLLFSGITWISFCRMAKKEFGGITGDLAGYFLELCELTLSAGLLLSGRLL